MNSLPPLPADVTPLRTGTYGWTRQALEDMAPESLVDMLRRVMDATNMKPMAQRTWLKMLRAVLVDQTATVNGWRASGRTFTLDAIAAGKGRLQMPPHPLAQENPTYFRCTFLGTPKSIAVHLTGGPDALEAAGQVARQYGLQAVLGGVPAWHDPGKALPVLYRPCPWDGKPGLDIPKLRGAT